MGFKLRLSTGECACSECYQSVEPSTTVCDSCSVILTETSEAKACPSCETLMKVDEKFCPICNEKLIFTKEEEIEREKAIAKQLSKDDEQFLSKLMTWAKGMDKTALPDTEEDKKEREKAMRVLSSITATEPEEAIEERIKEIEKTKIERKEIDKRTKELKKLGKPFEALLERNAQNLDNVARELWEKREDLKKLKGKKGKDFDEERRKLEKTIKILQKKKQAIMSYETNILMVGGAYRNLLGNQETELTGMETDLKKRVDALQKEVDRRKRQKDKLKNREMALDKREEELSNRFLELKRRENEIRVKGDKLVKNWEEMNLREEELKTWENEISTSKNPVVQNSESRDPTDDLVQEQWLNEQKKLQADLIMMRNEIVDAERSIHTNEVNERIDEMQNNLGKKEKELETITGKLQELSTIIIEKDKEIEKLKGSGSGFTVDEETRRMLKILDDLLEKLPEEIVDKFARSEDYLLYEKVLEKYKL